MVSIFTKIAMVANFATNANFANMATIGKIGTHILTFIYNIIYIYIIIILLHNNSLSIPIAIANTLCHLAKLTLMAKKGIFTFYTVEYVLCTEYKMCVLLLKYNISYKNRTKYIVENKIKTYLCIVQLIFISFLHLDIYMNFL